MKTGPTLHFPDWLDNHKMQKKWSWMRKDPVLTNLRSGDLVPTKYALPNAEVVPPVNEEVPHLVNPHVVNEEVDTLMNPLVVNEEFPPLMNEEQQQNDGSGKAKVITMEDLNRKIEYLWKVYHVNPLSSD